MQTVPISRQTGRLALAAFAALIAPPLVHAATVPPGLSRTVVLWAASPQQPVDPVVPSSPITLSGQTIRQIVRMSAAGTQLRVRLTNEYTSAPTVVGDVHVAIAQVNGSAGSGIVAGTDRAVTFGGQGSVTLAPNAAALSDPIDLSPGAFTSLAVSIYVSQGTAFTTGHAVGVQTGYVVPGDQTGALGLPAGGTTTSSRYLLSGVDATEANGGVTIVTLGDSLTDGLGSTFDANHRWPDILAERIQQTSMRYLTVANAGMSGNRLLSEGIGPNAESRLDRDVLAKPGVRYVTLLEGINDVGQGASGADVIAADRRIIARVHERGALIFGCTILPFKGAGYYGEPAERAREAVNDFIRHGNEFDGVIDFDAALRDPANWQVLAPRYDSGDHLHPNDLGYATMAYTVPLGLFTK